MAGIPAIVTSLSDNEEYECTWLPETRTQNQDGVDDHVPRTPNAFPRPARTSHAISTTETSTETETEPETAARRPNIAQTPGNETTSGHEAPPKIPDKVHARRKHDEESRFGLSNHELSQPESETPPKLPARKHHDEESRFGLSNNELSQPESETPPKLPGKENVKRAGTESPSPELPKKTESHQRHTRLIELACPKKKAGRKLPPIPTSPDDTTEVPDSSLLAGKSLRSHGSHTLLSQDRDNHDRHGANDLLAPPRLPPRPRSHGAEGRSRSPQVITRIPIPPRHQSASENIAHAHSPLLIHVPVPSRSSRVDLGLDTGEQSDDDYDVFGLG